MDDVITLYPSNWFYNASVIGFLRVIASAKGEEFIEKWLDDDGKVRIERIIFEESLKFYKNYNPSESEREEKLHIIGKNKRYPNYLQSGEDEAFEDYVKNLTNLSETGPTCGLCSRNFSIDFSQLSSDTKKIARRITSNFQIIHSADLGPSIGKFPNAFWNFNHSFSICPLCAYLIIHHHIPFESAQTRNGQIFINAPSFKVMWYLNKYTQQILSTNTSSKLREILGISFIEFAQRVSMTLGVWSVMNIEMVIKQVEKIDYYSLPYDISRILLQKDIASLISQTGEPVVLESVLKGDFEKLLELSHGIIRVMLTSKNSKNLKKLLPELKNIDMWNLNKLFRILPKIYVKINSVIKSEV